MTITMAASRSSRRLVVYILVPVVVVFGIQITLFRRSGLQLLQIFRETSLSYDAPASRSLLNNTTAIDSDLKTELPSLTHLRPHAGALDASGKPGYVHNVRYLAQHLLQLSQQQLMEVCSVPRGDGEEGPHGDLALRKIQIHNVPANVTRRRILCAVYTHSNRHDAVRAIAETWGPRCDGFFAASNLTDPSIGAVHLLHEGAEAYGNMWNKVKSMWAYMHDQFLTDYDYFYICGDDTFVVPENLRYAVSMASPSDPDEIYFAGRKMAGFPRPRHSFCGGGAGYTLSRGAVKKLVGELFPQSTCRPNHTASDEDRIVASCFRATGKNCMDDVDEKDEPRYHILDAEFHVRWKYGMVTPLHMDNLRKMHNVVLKEGLDSISTSSISFHLKDAKGTSEDRGLRRYHALLHKLCPSTSSMKLAEVPKGTSVKASSDRLVLDFVSIGSLSRLDFQQAQSSTFGRHPSVRHFFNVTEKDDAERDCSSKLSLDDTLAIAGMCRRKQWREGSLMQYQRNHYATRHWLKGKKDPAGWLCAQTRPIHGIAKALATYRNDMLPDYLVIMDDDSYYQVELVQKELQRFDADDAYVLAGCLIRSRVKESNFTIPYGGWGTILSRGAIKNLMKPVHCQKVSDRDDFTENACLRLEADQIGERYLFQDGMSVGELMSAYAAAQPFTSYANWTHGFCLHSDWALGFFFNFYFIGVHAGRRKAVPHDRMAGYLGSEIYAGRATAEVKSRYRECNND